MTTKFARLSGLALAAAAFAFGGSVDARAQALQSESFVDQAALDRYTFIRRAYLQRRAYLVRDGKPAPADEDD